MPTYETLGDVTSIGAFVSNPKTLTDALYADPADIYLDEFPASYYYEDPGDSAEVDYPLISFDTSKVTSPPQAITFFLECSLQYDSNADIETFPTFHIASYDWGDALEESDWPTPPVLAALSPFISFDHTDFASFADFDEFAFTDVEILEFTVPVSALNLSGTTRWICYTDFHAEEHPLLTYTEYMCFWESGASSGTRLRLTTTQALEASAAPVFGVTTRGTSTHVADAVRVFESDRVEVVHSRTQAPAVSAHSTGAGFVFSCWDNPNPGLGLPAIRCYPTEGCEEEILFADRGPTFVSAHPGVAQRNQTAEVTGFAAFDNEYAIGMAAFLNTDSGTATTDRWGETLAFLIRRNELTLEEVDRISLYQGTELHRAPVSSVSYKGGVCALSATHALAAVWFDVRLPTTLHNSGLQFNPVGTYGTNEEQTFVVPDHIYELDFDADAGQGSDGGGGPGGRLQGTLDVEPGDVLTIFAGFRGNNARTQGGQYTYLKKNGELMFILGGGGSQGDSWINLVGLYSATGGDGGAGSASGSGADGEDGTVHTSHPDYPAVETIKGSGGGIGGPGAGGSGGSRGDQPGDPGQNGSGSFGGDGGLSGATGEALGGQGFGGAGGWGLYGGGGGGGTSGDSSVLDGAPVGAGAGGGGGSGWYDAAAISDPVASTSLGDGRVRFAQMPEQLPSNGIMFYLLKRTDNTFAVVDTLEYREFEWRNDGVLFLRNGFTSSVSNYEIERISTTAALLTMSQVETGTPTSYGGYFVITRDGDSISGVTRTPIVATREWQVRAAPHGEFGVLTDIGSPTGAVVAPIDIGSVVLVDSATTLSSLDIRGSVSTNDTSSFQPRRINDTQGVIFYLASNLNLIGQMFCSGASRTLRAVLYTIGENLTFGPIQIVSNYYFGSHFVASRVADDGTVYVIRDRGPLGNPLFCIQAQVMGDTAAGIMASNEVSVGLRSSVPDFRVDTWPDGTPVVLCGQPQIYAPSAFNLDGSGNSSSSLFDDWAWTPSDHTMIDNSPDPRTIIDPPTTSLDPNAWWAPAFYAWNIDVSVLVRGVAQFVGQEVRIWKRENTGG